MKIISSKAHAILDYITVIFLFASPTIFKMDHALSNFTYVLAIIHMLLTISTRYEFGLLKIIPFRIHGIIEFIVAIALIGAAFWFNRNGNDLGFSFYLYLAVVIVVVFLLTDFKAGSKTASERA